MLDLSCFLPVLAQTDPVLALGLSVLGTVVLFVLVRLAMFLYRSQDRNLLIFARRIADIDAKTLRLELVVENLENHAKSLSNIRILSPEGETLATLNVAPIQRSGSPTFIHKEAEGGYGLFAEKNSKAEAVLEFSLSKPCRQVYLAAENQKGRTVKANFDLSSSSTQMLSFRKA